MGRANEATHHLSTAMYHGISLWFPYDLYGDTDSYSSTLLINTEERYGSQNGFPRPLLWPDKSGEIWNHCPLETALLAAQRSSTKMSACGRKALTLLSSVFAVCGLGLLGIAVSTDYWLYLEEGIILPQNQSTEVKMSLHSGLWRVCFLAEMIRSATPFPLVSLFFMFIGFILSNIGHIRPHRTILAFVSGIFFILSGLSLVVGLVLYISSINDEMLNRTKDAETYFNYKYGWSFAFAAISFLLTESAGVMSVYLFMKRYTAEDMYRPHPGFYRPRLSNCSDYSGQFLHPDAWIRGRSPSDISSDASLQMNSNYPALLKCPDYDQMSSSPC
ncbi:voltage-dependent calcium channel gamma-5 subunit-like protein [Cricetulus griseus]|nr:voltage-dependent calcium channel gamma-5 subunit-like protein [Cricetulus griseus]